ncbi:MAG: ATP-dependent DNA helicase [Candidatus Diapherotrites archaeon]|jgi:DNA excision repair protein ERCC-2|uniref:ATP-dependent DNA helicase n=1 Tax=Candidatus Iainarchaeum sp. TaxID=3101447 RepID=A0A7K4BZA1_9ARCH|nr:ATP-dependent DNA helicase [Candidatus Diapherotrites archaeon]
MQVFFPYEFVRPQQKELIRDIVECIDKRKILLAHAPTGLGKTVSSLAPIISYARKNSKKIFFITPKVSQHQIVIDTIKEINEKFDFGVTAVDLVGRKQMCLDPFIKNVSYGFYEACNKKKKEHTCRFYENCHGTTPKQKVINARRKRETLTKYNNNYLLIKEICEIKSLCPYEITLEMAKKADVIIGDYFHLFDKDIRTGILTPNGITLEDVIVIVDEAHNTPHRLRDMLSSTLNADSIEKAAKEAKTAGNFEVEFLMNDIGKEIMSLGKKLSLTKSEAILTFEDFDSFKRMVKGKEEIVLDAAGKFMQKAKIENCNLLMVWEFMHELLREKENTLHVIERRNGLRVSIYPLDIEEIGGEVLNNVHSGVLMSGTLLPLEMYKDILGIKNVEMKEYESPFDKKNRLNIVVEGVSTKYTKRGTESYSLIGEKVSKIISKVPGNTIVFFPSFEMLGSISPYIKTNRKTFVQTQEMSNEEKHKTIHSFKAMGSAFGGVLLAVSGGSIAEGVDFPGEHLLCAIVVGIPFAKVSIYSDALIRFYDQKYKKGWDYAYNGPAFSKAIQAAGRVIRSETDKGVCVFLDERFAEERYKKFYPKNFEYVKTKEPEKEVKKFFEN